jgi:hypothetical protein
MRVDVVVDAVMIDGWMLGMIKVGKKMVRWGEGEQSGYVLEPRVCGRSSGGLGEGKV